MTAPRAPGAPVLVVGDSMLDRYWEGAVERISPEAPVPVLRMGREWQRAGGAANVALNLAALGRTCTLATLLGRDEAGDQLSRLMEGGGVELVAVRCDDMPTTQKIRTICRRQQLLRVDFEQPAPAERARELADRVADLLPAHRLVLLSDYAKGALADPQALLTRAAARGCRVLVDPKGDHFERYAGAWLLKPNEAEARRAAGLGGGADPGTGDAAEDEAFDAAMQRLREALGVEHLLVTRGERGMVLYPAQRAPLRVPAQVREVYDVSGAGDTVLATLAAALAAGETLDDAVALANRAAGVAVGKFGTAVVSRAELDAAPAAPAA
jgi:rfaE bifunctional protein kinase chain/domain